jgi:hypothetical protein
MLTPLTQLQRRAVSGCPLGFTSLIGGQPPIPPLGRSRASEANEAGAIARPWRVPRGGSRWGLPLGGRCRERACAGGCLDDVVEAAHDRRNVAALPVTADVRHRVEGGTEPRSAVAVDRDLLERLAQQALSAVALSIEERAANVAHAPDECWCYGHRGLRCSGFEGPPRERYLTRGHPLLVRAQAPIHRSWGSPGRRSQRGAWPSRARISRESTHRAKRNASGALGLA